MKCPSCNKTIGWLQQGRFAEWKCSRKTAECPHCSVELTWAKWPHRLIQLGTSLMLFGFWSKFLFPVNILDGFDVYFVCMSLALAMLIPGLFLQRFDVIGENTK